MRLTLRSKAKRVEAAVHVLEVGWGGVGVMDAHTGRRFPPNSATCVAQGSTAWSGNRVLGVVARPRNSLKLIKGITFMSPL